VRDVGVRPMGFWGLWCQFTAGAMVRGRNGCLVEVVEAVGEGFGYAVVGAVGEGSNGVEPRAYAPIDKEYRECTTSLRGLLAPY
jgi:hypothetical protein